MGGLAWDDYYLEMARLSSLKSKDPSTKVGSVLVVDNTVVATSYNGLPRGVPDSPAILQDREKKLGLVIHAEENCLIFARRDLRGATCYVWPMPPCSNCAAKLIQAGITRIVAPAPTTEQAERWGASFALAEWAYQQAGVELVIADEP